MKSEEILKQFEDDLVAGKNPTPAEYQEKYGKIEPETRSLMEVMMGLVLLGEEATLPAGFHARQRKVAREVIARKKAEEMVAHLMAGNQAFKENNYLAAYEHYQKLLTFVQYIKDETWVAFVSSRLGNITSLMGDLEKAREHHQTARSLYRKLGMKLEEAICLHNLAQEELEKKDYERARELYQEAIMLNEELGASFALAHEYLNLGAIEQHLGRKELARKYYTDSLRFFSQRKDTNGMGMAEYNLAEQVEDEAEAIRLYQSALKRFQEVANWGLLAQTCGKLAAWEISKGEYQKARDLFALGEEALTKTTPGVKPTREELVSGEIPQEAKADPARLLRFLLDKDAEEMQYQKQ